MGSVVKSIGKAIKKVGKGIKKIVKKIGPALLVAAAVYAGVAFYGAGGLAGGVGSLSPTNFMTGLNKLGTGIKSFFMPQGMAPTAGASGIAPTMGEQAAATYAGGNVRGEFSTATAITQGSASALNPVKTLMSSVAGGMTTGDAMVYMTKMNMLKSGAGFIAGLLDDSEKKQMEHEKQLLSMKYSYGAPSTDEQKDWLAQNPDWMSKHPTTKAPTKPDPSALSKAMGTGGLPASLASQIEMPNQFVNFQNVGQPVFGRQSTRQYETPAPSAAYVGKPGMITQLARMKGIA